MPITKEQIEYIKTGYFHALEWLTWGCPDTRDLLEIPENFDPDNLDDSVDLNIEYRINQFIKDCPESLIFEYAEYMQEFHAGFNDRELYHGFQSLGHDLYLTSHGHGTGFYDRGIGELGNRLTGYAERIADINIWYQDDKIHAE